MKISVTTTINAPLAKVWQAYTTPSDILQWNAASDDWHTTHALVDLRAGGAFTSRMEAKDGSFGFDFAGTYTQVILESLIEYTFGDRTARVSFDEVADGVHVCVEFDPEKENPEDMQRQGWQAILQNFAQYVESTK